jgi:SSS family solute:Na+ symporter
LSFNYQFAMSGVSTIDTIVIVAYLAGIMLIGLLSVRRTTLTGEEYFLAGRSLRWPIVGSALFASNISTIHLVGLAEGGYKHGLVIGNFEWMATFTLMILALVFVPFYFKSHITTLPEYLEKRYGRLARTIMAFMAIAAALLIHIGISLYAGAAVFQEFFGLDVVASIVIISAVTAIYTVIGGLKAVVVTETVQTFILLGGAVLVTFLAVLALPNAGVHTWDELRAVTKPDQLSMLHTSNQDGYAWYAFLLGYPVLGIWYWCSDQTIVQRALGAKDQLNAQNGALFAGLLKITPVFFMVLPGVFGYVLFRERIGEQANQTLPVMINELVPVGLRGIVAAALLAALMSTIAAALNSVGTLMAVDIVKHFRPQTTDREQVQVGRVTAVAVMLLAMAWSTQGGKFGTIFEAINKMPAQFLAPPISVVFLWGVFWRRGTKQAALATLLLGFVLGFIVFLIDLPAFGTIQWISDPNYGLGITFMMQAVWGFLIWSIVYVIVSLATPPPPPEQVATTTWPEPMQVIFRDPLSGASDPRIIAGALLALMIVLYSVFR